MSLPINKLLSRVLMLAGLGLAVAIVAWLAVRMVSKPSHAAAPPASRPGASSTVAAANPSPPSPPATESASAVKTAGASSAATANAVPAPADETVGASLPPAPAEELIEVVRKFSISEVKPGRHGRALIDGTVHYVGERVGHGLEWFEIKDGGLIFLDERGARYPRRY